MVAVTPDDLRVFAVRRRWLASSLLLLLLLGIISFAPVREATADCPNEYLVADDGVTRLTTDDGKFLTTGRIWLDLAGIRFLLPDGVRPILLKLGLMPAQCR